MDIHTSNIVEKETRSMQFGTDFERQLWNDGKHAMYFDLEDDSVVAIIKNCVDNRKDIDRCCTIENLKYNLLPISQIENYIKYITRYNSDVLAKCFNYLLSMSDAHKTAFLACARMYAAEKLKLEGTETEKLRNYLRSYGLYDYMVEFNERVGKLLSNEGE